MSVRMDAHTLERAVERGTSEEEILDVLTEKQFSIVKKNRKRKANVFPFNAEWNGVFYRAKKVDVVYVEEQGDSITATAIVKFGTWSE